MPDVQLYNPATNLVQSYDEDTARERVRAGLGEVASPERIERDRIERKYAGGLGNQATALAAGLGRGVTFGLSDVALTELGGDDYREALRAYRELHPLTSTVGELAGAALVPIPGAGAAASVGEATLASVGRAALREAAVGGAYGLGAGLSEAALSGEGYKGEALAASLGLGALIGGGIGGAVAGGKYFSGTAAQGLKSAIVRPGEEALAHIGSEALGEQAAQGFGGAVGRVFAKSSELAGVEGASEGASLMAINRAGAELRSRAANATETIERQVAVVAENSKKIENAAKLLQEKAGSAKREQWSQLAHTERPAEALSAARSQARTMGEQLGRAIEDGEGNFARPDQLKKALGRTSAALEKMGKTESPAQAAWLLDELKRDIGILAKKTGAKATLSSEQATANLFQSLHDEAAQVLQNPSIWGEKAAQMQQSLDKATAFSRVDDISEKLKNATDPANAKALEAWRGQQLQVKERAQAALDHMSLSKAERSQLSSVPTAVDRNVAALDSALDAAKLDRQLNGMKSRDGSVLGMIMAGVAGGFFVGDGDLNVAGPLALAAGVIANPRRSIRQLAGLESLIRRGMRTTEKAGGQIIKQAGTVAQPAVWSAAGAKRAAILKAVQTINNTTPQQVADQTRSNFGLVAPTAPKAVEAAIDVSIRAHEYLQKHAPQAQARPGVIMSLGLPPSDYELEIFDRRREIVNDPFHILKEIKRGTLTPEAVDALQAVYPEMHKQLKQNITVQLGELAGRGESLPYRQVMPLELLLGQPIEGINSKDVVDTIQQTYSRELQGPGGVKQKETFKTKLKAGRPSPEVSQLYNSTTEDSALREIG